jgi:ubiquinone/menaquinone biosynthesis C-methylase UbiE
VAVTEDHPPQHASDPPPHAAHHHPLPSALTDLLMAASMTVGRAPVARRVPDLARVVPTDQVLDVGCGPGTAVRVAAGRGATAVGVDPSAVALSLARAISRWQGTGGVEWLAGEAEALPVADASMSVVWALSSVHHWRQRAGGLSEIQRVLAPGGRVLLVERRTQPGARGHAGHGVSDEDADRLADEATTAGLAGIRRSTLRVGRRTVVVVSAGAPWLAAL